MTGCFLALALVASAPEGGPLSLADLDAYRAALEGARGRPVDAGFRDLWRSPESYRGRLVRVEGSVARRFRQAAVGKFPALAELWVTSDRGDPLCLIFPDPPGEFTPGERVRFEGTFLKWLRYRGGDTDRLAPLIVGGRAPVAASRRAASGMPWSGRSTLDWIIALALAAVVGVVLAMRHLQRPARRREAVEAAPVFADQDDRGVAKKPVSRDPSFLDLA
jgi:hypothetical protein